MLRVLLLCLFLLGASHAVPFSSDLKTQSNLEGACNTLVGCTLCAKAHTWTGAHCRYCPKDYACHAEGSAFNPCSGHEQITNASLCPITPVPPKLPPQPKPVPAPPAVDTSTIDLKKLLQELFDKLGISANATTCFGDFNDSAAELRNFAHAFERKNYTTALHSLGGALTSVGSACGDCAVPQLQAKLDALAAAVHFANVTRIDGAVKILVSASEASRDLGALATAISSKDAAAAAAALGSLIADWSTVTGGCSGSGSAGCHIVDGLLKIMQVVSGDLQGSACASSLEVAYATFDRAVGDMRAKNVTAAVLAFAAGLDELAKALTDDVCGLKRVGAAIAEMAPRLAKAKVVRKAEDAYSVLVGYADVYEELYQAAQDAEQHNWADFGVQMGLLLQQLRASGCETKACVVLEGLLAALQIEATDYSACSDDIDHVWGAIREAIHDFDAKEYVAGLENLGAAVSSLAHGVGACGLPQLGTAVESMLRQLGLGSAAVEVGDVVTALVNGADVTILLNQSVGDFKAQRWSAVGHDLGQLALKLNQTGCKSFVCEIAEGLLEHASIAFSDLEKCEADFKAAEPKFISGIKAFEARQYAAAIKDFSAGLSGVAKAVGDCGIAPQLQLLQHEANMLGLANVTIFGEAAAVVVRGTDFYKEIVAMTQAFKAHDYKAAGEQLGQLLDTLSKWTTGHSCTSDGCYILEGVMQFIGIFDGSFKECESDLKFAVHNFSAGFVDLADSHHGIFNYKHDDGKIKAGIKAFGLGFDAVAASVSACHMQQVAELLAALAARLGLTPEVAWLEEVLKILIEGVQVEHEIGDACTDYAAGNWAGFGYNLARLLKTLLL